MDEMAWATKAVSPSIYDQAVPSIGFIDDVFRHAYWPAKEFFYDLLSMPLSHISGAPCWPSVRRMMWAEGLLTPPTQPPGSTSDDTLWLSQYRVVSDEARALLRQYVDVNSTYICYEGSPGLLAFLNDLNITYIDVRISPLRFLPDVLVAMRSNSERINRLLHSICLSRREIAREASFLMASFRHRERYEKPIVAEPSRPPVFYIGQTPSDASIIVDQKYFTLQDAAGTLAPLVRDRDVFYLRHPTTTDQHVKGELETLASFQPRSLQNSRVNSYDLMAAETSAEFVALSSGLIQEAAFFGKDAHAVLPHICELAFSDEPQAGHGYYQFSFDTFTSDALWGAIVNSAEFQGRDSVSKLKTNQLRELHNVWWAYPGHKVRSNDYTRALTGGLQSDVGLLNRRSNFLFNLVSTDVDATDVLTAAVSARRWSWINGGTVQFEANGILMKDGRRAGIWRRVNARPNAMLAIWDEGGWLDLVEYDGGNILACKNDFGHAYTVLAA